MPKAYYNEHDPKAAAWLRELIKAGLIMDGVVDERSIADVSPDDLAGYDRCHFFAGIGGWELALQLAGWPIERPVWTGSCPCQPFSTAGRRKGVDDERHLWPEFARLIAACRPECVFGEQVAGAIKHGWLDGVCTDVEAAGYTVGVAVLGAHSVNAPHIRQRLFWVADSTESRHAGAGQRQATDGIRADSVPQRRLALDEPAWGGPTRGLPDANGNGCDQTGLSLATSGSDGTVGTREPDWLPDEFGQCPFCGYEFDIERLGRYGCPNCYGDGPGDSIVPRLERLAGNGDDGNQPGRINAHAPGSIATAGGSFWSDFDFIPCGDGKTRRLKPGLKPLASRLPIGVVPSCDISESYALNTSEARVMRLRGYGNAINLYTAAEFIAAFMETENLTFETEMREVQLSQFELDNE